MACLFLLKCSVCRIFCLVVEGAVEALIVWKKDLHITIQSMPITTKVVNLITYILAFLVLQ